MSASATRSVTSTFAEQVMRVTRKVQSDLLTIVDWYAPFSAEEAQKYVHDMRVLMDEEVLERVEFTWLRRGTTEVLRAKRYEISNGDDERPNDRAGALVYEASLASAAFEIRFWTEWSSVSTDARTRIESDLQLPWRDAAPLNYGGRSFTYERTYGQQQVGIKRYSL